MTLQAIVKAPLTMWKPTRPSRQKQYLILQGLHGSDPNLITEERQLSVSGHANGQKDAAGSKGANPFTSNSIATKMAPQPRDALGDFD